MPKPNILLFTWENTIFIEREVQKWLELFSTKHGEHNISRLSPAAQLSTIQWELTALPFFAEKRLVILEDFMVKKKNDDESEEPASNEGKSSVEWWIADNIDNIPDSTVAVFVQNSPQLTNKLYKQLKEIATIRRFDNLEPGDLRKYVKDHLPTIEFSAITKLISYKNNNLPQIDQEILKLSLFFWDEQITESDIEKYVVPTQETSIFKLIDAILVFDKITAIKELSVLLQTDGIFMVFSSIMANLRKNLYIIKLLEAGLKSVEIVDKLDVKPFLVDKAARIGSKTSRLKQLFSELTELDRASKTGDMVGEWDVGLEMALQKILLSL